MLTRINELVIPPAWKDVWVCPYPGGHIQATGVDERGRKQYLYHRRWRERQDQRKFDDMIEFAGALPALRRRVDADLAGERFAREQILACAVRLLDRGLFRIGTEDYAVTNETYGLATMKKRHVRTNGDTLLFDYPAKHGKRQVRQVLDPDVVELVASLKARRGGTDELLAYKRKGALGRRQVRRHQRLPQGRDRPRRLGQGLPHLGRDRAGGRRPRRLPARPASPRPSASA